MVSALTSGLEPILVVRDTVLDTNFHGASLHPGV